ncbi:MAG: HlyD family secretion protein [Nitrospirae bacterium]|nr:HlyD family secretion protein [Candidatus Manganitrophaceae bacterium]
MNRRADEELQPDRPGSEAEGPPPVRAAVRPEAISGAPRRPPYQRPRFILLFLVVLIALIFGLRYYLHSRGIESTDDAYIEAHVVQVSPRVAGHVIEVSARDNQEVKKGDRLVAIDPRDYEVRLAQARAGEVAARGKLKQAETQLPVARANLGQAQAEVQVAQTTADLRETDLKRLQQLGELVSQQQLDQANSAFQTSRAQLVAARRRAAGAEAQVAAAESQVQTSQAEVEQAVVAVQQADLELTYTRIFAPDEGRVTRRSVEPGMYVQPGQALLALVPKQVWVVANFKETQLNRMRPGQPVEIRVDAYPGKIFNGHIDSIQAGSGARFSLLPPENATGNFVKVVQRFPVKIVFDGPNDAGAFLAPGMSVRPEVRLR